MAQTPANEIAVADLHRALKKLARRKPGVTYKDIHRWAIREHDSHLTDETFRRALAGGADPTKCGADLLIMLMAFYGATPDEMGEHAARRIRSVMSAIGPVLDGGEQHKAATDRTCTDAKVVPFPARRTA